MKKITLQGVLGFVVVGLDVDSNTIVYSITCIADAFQVP